MAYIIGLETEENIAELERRGWEAEKPPVSLGGQELQAEMVTAGNPCRMVQFWVDTGVFDIMNGPDWEKNE